MTALPYATGYMDTVVYGCKDVCMSPWVCEAYPGQKQYSGLSCMDKAIVTHSVTLGLVILPNFLISYPFLKHFLPITCYRTFDFECKQKSTPEP